jgi:hypothetical protein
MNEEFKKLEKDYEEIQKELELLKEEEVEEEELSIEDLEASFKDAELNSKAIQFPKSDLLEAIKHNVVSGWLCPKCNKVNAPTILQCICYNQQPYKAIEPYRKPWKNPYDNAFPNWPTHIYYH